MPSRWECPPPLKVTKSVQICVNTGWLAAVRRHNNGTLYTPVAMKPFGEQLMPAIHWHHGGQRANQSHSLARQVTVGVTNTLSGSSHVAVQLVPAAALLQLSGKYPLAMVGLLVQFRTAVSTRLRA
jgi:hypothetical protein